MAEAQIKATPPTKLTAGQLDKYSENMMRLLTMAVGRNGSIYLPPAELLPFYKYSKDKDTGLATCRVKDPKPKTVEKVNETISFICNHINQIRSFSLDVETFLIGEVPEKDKAHPRHLLKKVPLADRWSFDPTNSGHTRAQMLAWFEQSGFMKDGKPLGKWKKNSENDMPAQIAAITRLSEVLRKPPERLTIADYHKHYLAGLLTIHKNSPRKMLSTLGLTLQ